MQVCNVRVLLQSIRRSRNPNILALGTAPIARPRSLLKRAERRHATQNHPCAAWNRPTPPSPSTPRGAVLARGWSGNPIRPRAVWVPRARRLCEGSGARGCRARCVLFEDPWNATVGRLIVDDGPGGRRTRQPQTHICMEYDSSLCQNQKIVSLPCD